MSLLLYILITVNWTHVNYFLFHLLFLLHLFIHSSPLFCTFSSVVRQMPGYNSPRLGTARTLPNFLCCSMYCLFFYRCLCIIIVMYSLMQLPWLRFFCAFSSIVRQMPGYNSPSRGMACTLPNFLCCSMYCLFLYRLCLKVYCTTATGWQPNCS